jgi:hypothetical protein
MDKGKPVEDAESTEIIFDDPEGGTSAETATTPYQRTQQ